MQAPMAVLLMRRVEEKGSERLSEPRALESGKGKEVETEKDEEVGEQS
jgi:hypothetical protein